MAFNDLGLVLSLTGAVAASVLGYILPGLIYIKTYDEEFQGAWSACFQEGSREFEYVSTVS